MVRGCGLGWLVYLCIAGPGYFLFSSVLSVMDTSFFLRKTHFGRSLGMHWSKTFFCLSGFGLRSPNLTVMS